MTTRKDPRYITLMECSDEQAVELGVKYRAWLNSNDMGGWSGDNLNDFIDAVADELEFAVKDREAINNVDFIVLVDPMEKNY